MVVHQHFKNNVQTTRTTTLLTRMHVEAVGERSVNTAITAWWQLVSQIVQLMHLQQVAIGALLSAKKQKARLLA